MSNYDDCAAQRELTGFRVLYIIDNANREQLAANLVKYELEARGCDVRFASRYVIATSFNSFHPDVVILPKIHKIPELVDLAKRCHIALLPAESFTGSVQSTRLSYEISQECNDLVDIRFCWGSFDKNVLAKAGLFREGVLAVTGHPMTDSWYMPLSKSKVDKKLVIGISSTLKVLANTFGDRNFVSLVDALEKNNDANGKSIFFDEPNHAELWVGFEAAFIRIMVNIADEFPECEIRIRPHPTERASDYLALARKRPNVYISEGGDIADWLDEIDVLLSFISASQIDASVRGKKVISLKNLFPVWVRDGLPKRLRLPVDNLFPAPGSMKELRALLAERYVENPSVREYVADIFNYRSRRRPSQQVADYLCSYLSRHDKKAKAGTSMPTSRSRFFFRFPYGDLLLMAALDLKSLLTRSKGGVSHSYCFHRFSRNSNIARRAFEVMQTMNHEISDRNPSNA